MKWIRLLINWAALGPLLCLLWLLGNIYFVLVMVMDDEVGMYRMIEFGKRISLGLSSAKFRTGSKFFWHKEKDT